jgi:carbamoyl-phosphate synthase small subunit
VFRGLSFGARGETGGETVFNTGMTGYQEVITDPSYHGQMVVMTVPHVGNYGVNPEDAESSRPWLAGFIVREACAQPSSWRSKESLPDYLEKAGVVGIEGVDTRALVLLLREKGAMRGIISTKEESVDTLVDRARAFPPIEGRDLVAEVTCRKPYEWTENLAPLQRGFLDGEPPAPRNGFAGLLPGETSPLRGGPAIAVVDCGVKFNILRSLASRGCRVTVVPAHSAAADILALKPDGVLFSNGPGDPERLPAVSACVRGLLGKVPVFGICLGHQVIGRALGARTFKLKFGHHGCNHPVKDLANGTVAITSQNHNYAVDAATLPREAEVTHLNLNDETVEGLRHAPMRMFSVQYHPEACPGPHDAAGLFGRFVSLIARESGRGRT